MSLHEIICDVMKRIGPVLNLDRVTEFEARRLWTLDFDEATTIDVEYDEALQRLMLTTAVGPVEAARQTKTYEALLNYNFMWSSHGGVRAALDPTSRVVVMMVETPAPNLRLEKFCSVLQNFRDLARDWRIALASNSVETQAQPLDVGAMIRV